MINLKLNGTKIPSPKEEVKIDPLEIAREDRMASGRKVKDIKTTKDTFTLDYDGLLPDDAMTFINAYRDGGPVTFEYEDVEGKQSKQVYIQPLPRKIYAPKPQYTKEITITLEEE
ncbi:hypothetical protein [Sporohalobacter salinus]|uniref:hypothetical protein n=1 Tax=Sporohalobacter salinus TaxID=1494606 RepID=UPI00195F77F2|nr:hypothetical protein [Sporohalobacter salinus]MBM7624786.1 hypothetical protein [Sporohalobacter salinus]